MNEEAAPQAAPEATIRVVGVGVSDVGLERKNNEDAFHVDEDYGLFVVCDGMGGHASGEIASRIAVETMVDFVTRTVHEEGFRFPFSPPDAATHETRVLDSAVRLANRTVFAESQEDVRHKGMGTTVVAVLAGTQDVAVVHVGDSRVYRYRGADLTQVTEDHSLLNHYRRTRPMTDEEIRTFKGKNVIVRAVGLRDAVQPEVQTVDVEPGDLLLLCTDGLSDLVDDNRIAAVLAEQGEDLQAAVDTLVQLALDAGGKDNVTVMLLRVEDGPAAPHVARPVADEQDDEDTSPGFVAGLEDGAWDQETMPSYDLPPLPDGERPAVVVAPELVDAPTPRELPAITPADIARATAGRRPGVDSKGKPIPLPPGVSPPASDTPPAGLTQAPVAQGGDDAVVVGTGFDLDAATPPAMPSARSSFTDTSPDIRPPIRIDADDFDELGDTAPRPAIPLQAVSPSAALPTLGETPRVEQADLETPDDAPVEREADAWAMVTAPDHPKDADDSGDAGQAAAYDFDTEVMEAIRPELVAAHAAAKSAPAPGFDPGAESDEDEVDGPLLGAQDDDEDVWAGDDDDVWGSGSAHADTAPIGADPEPKAALDPALAKMMQRSSVRRSVIPRANRPPEAERPFTPKKSEDGGDDDHDPSLGAAIEGGGGRKIDVTAPYAAARSTTIEVDEDAGLDPMAWDAPTEAVPAIGLEDDDDDQR
ncbi:MAG: Stp1/IreP family PP2C-type Ser/Thr phosphatase [Deltaproteobacteria bacterium]|nr:Stp1/IreP family PP2C-type Ser/Thr phosphatase [Deltaproteobacteria bacterium]